MSNVLKIGTRGSPLAIAQTKIVLQLLQQAYPHDSYIQNYELIEVKTTGDKILNQSLADIGGKSLFTKELDRALLEGYCDIAVHSLKDIETKLNPAIIIAAIPEREDIRDVWISKENQSIHTIKPNSIFGSCAPRRIAQIQNLRPDLRFTTLRGNIHSRIQKVKTGVIDAALFAHAGLKRSGVMSEDFEIFEPNVIVPAVGQGAIAVTCRAQDIAIYEYIHTINHQPTELLVTTERAMLEALGGSCHTPIAGYAKFIDSENIKLTGLIAALNGSKIIKEKLTGINPEQLGKNLAEKLIKNSDGEYFKWQKAMF